MNRIDKDRQLIADEMQQAAEANLFQFFEELIGDGDPRDKKVQERLLRDWHRREDFTRYNMPALMLYLTMVRGVNPCRVHVSIKCANADTRRLARAMINVRQDLSRQVTPLDAAGATIPA